MTKKTEAKARGQSPSVTQRVVEATLNVLEELGAPGLKMELIAERAHVHRTTLYRRYSDIGELIKAVIEEQGVAMKTFPDTGGLYSDVHAMTYGFADYLQTPIIVALNLAIANQSSNNPSLTHWINERWQGNLHKFEAILKRAEDRGETVNYHNIITAIEVITGPMLSRTLMLNRPIDTQFSGQLADIAYGLLTDKGARTQRYN